MHDARGRSDALFQILDPAALYDRPLTLRHRFIFYLGHLEAFDFNQICRRALNQPALVPAYDKLFEFGIDPPAGRPPQDQPSDWPVLGQVRSYVRQARERVDAALDEAPDDIVAMAIEHRLMHVETLAYMLHDVDYAKKRMPVSNPVLSGGEVRQQMVRIPAGPTTLGALRDGEFHWDNEYDRHLQQVPGFAISKYKVTNGEYLAFVNAGGPAPKFWVQRDGAWLWRGMFAEVPLPLDWPVWASQEQASAYAAWKGLALPTEAQFHRAAFARPEGGEALYPWGDRLSAAHGNFDFRHWDPVSVTAYPESASAFGVAQPIGNGWEWTSTQFAPFAGFEPHPVYPGYSADFFDGHHFVLKGASPRTSARLVRRSFRNWFRADYPHVYAGFRVVENRV